MSAKKDPETGSENLSTPPDYAASLRRATEKQDGVAKRSRTRAKLKLAAFTLMRREGILSLKVTSVTKAAGLASGTFYTHFQFLDDLVLEVVGEFFDMEARPALPLGAGEEPFEAMKNAFLYIVRLFRRNIMIFKSLEELRGREPLFRKVWTDFDDRWARQFASVMMERPGQQETDPKLAIMLGHAALAMVDEVLLRIFHDRYDDLLAFGDDDETIAELLAVCRYRLLFAADPPPEKLSVARSLIGLG